MKSRKRSTAREQIEKPGFCENHNERSAFLPSETRFQRRLERLSWGVISLTVLIGLVGGSLQITSAPGQARTIDRLQSRDVVVPHPTAIVQLQRPVEIWPLVYEELPDLPLENNYVSTEGGEKKADNTLVGRLVRYHFYVKRRPPNFRFDWKLTLADYLGANELMQESTYPGYESLKENPMEGDRQAIKSMTRAQRNALIDVLVGIFGANTAGGGTSTPPTPTATPKPSTPSLPPLPGPGDADLLKL